jgi:hypothetical protein
MSAKLRKQIAKHFPHDNPQKKKLVCRLYCGKACLSTRYSVESQNCPWIILLKVSVYRHLIGDVKQFQI